MDIKQTTSDTWQQIDIESQPMTSAARVLPPQDGIASDIVRSVLRIASAMSHWRPSFGDHYSATELNHRLLRDIGIEPQKLPLFDDPTFASATSRKNG